MSSMTLTQLKDIMANCSGADEATEVSEAVASHPFPELGYDSLAVLEIVSHVQRQFGIAIPDDDVEGLATPQAMVEYVNARVTATV